MRKQFLITMILIFLLLLSGCSSDPNEKANDLYVNLLKYTQSMSTEAESYVDALKYYKSAKVDIERILSEYPASYLAIKLSSGEMEVSGFTLSEFMGLGSLLNKLAEAEQNLIFFALLVTNEIKDKSSRSVALSEIALMYAEAGHRDQQQLERGM